MKPAIKPALLGAALAALPGAVCAHTGVGDTSGLMLGFLHPVGGLDHILAMVAVGMFAACLGGRALLLVPAAFLTMMGVGGGLAISGIGVPFVESGIAASVIALGLAVALQWRLSTLAAMALAGFCALFHGHAHGAEMPADASGVSFALGFIAATALLHAAGVLAGLAIARTGAGKSRAALQAGGGLMAAAGAGMLAGLF